MNMRKKIAEMEAALDATLKAAETFESCIAGLKEMFGLSEEPAATVVVTKDEKKQVPKIVAMDVSPEAKKADEDTEEEDEGDEEFLWTIAVVKELQNGKKRKYIFCRDSDGKKNFYPKKNLPDDADVVDYENEKGAAQAIVEMIKEGDLPMEGFGDAFAYKMAVEAE